MDDQGYSAALSGRRVFLIIDRHSPGRLFFFSFWKKWKKRARTRTCLCDDKPCTHTCKILLLTYSLLALIINIATSLSFLCKRAKRETRYIEENQAYFEEGGEQRVYTLPCSFSSFFVCRLPFKNTRFFSGCQEECLLWDWKGKERKRESKIYLKQKIYLCLCVCLSSCSSSTFKNVYMLAFLLALPFTSYTKCQLTMFILALLFLQVGKKK